MTEEHPEKVFTLSIPGATPPEISLRRILDTGVDITILSLATWPLEWPLIQWRRLSWGWQEWCNATAENWSWGDGGFGSTGPPQVHWTAVMTEEPPEKVFTLSIPGATLPEIRLRRILDIGVDITILPLSAWPLEWPSIQWRHLSWGWQE
ncbi:hypothetical protein HGM15179_021944 [Zosterops borbonicus]|uniref:Peptidase A2 domain-containing protein n=1 Tax=Zosterops borbonicus TaxID=364589 RepID=A0A8K1D447_9PASS|nr:hypothetical protein HGM15179_021944 [Zosterops borbonicus]